MCRINQNLKVYSKQVPLLLKKCYLFNGYKNVQLRVGSGSESRSAIPKELFTDLEHWYKRLTVLQECRFEWKHFPWQGKNWRLAYSIYNQHQNTKFGILQISVKILVRIEWLTTSKVRVHSRLTGKDSVKFTTQLPVFA